jgi:hypothetical protein
MKKIFNLAFLSLILFGCAAKKELGTPVVKDIDEPLVTEGTYYWIMKPQVTIRENNSASSQEIGSLEEGDSVLVSTNKDGWYFVNAQDTISGWVRTDLLGPKNLSIVARAVDFAEEMKDKHKIDVFYDKQLFYKRIYLSFPLQDYTDKSEVKIKAIRIAQEYQKSVYRGEVTVRVLQPASEKEYLTFSQKGYPNPEIKLPVLPFGRLENVSIDDPEEIMISVIISNEIDNEKLLASAREISADYPLSYKKVQLKFISENRDCRLWFQEDQNGEIYDFEKCPE